MTGISDAFWCLVCGTNGTFFKKEPCTHYSSKRSGTESAIFADGISVVGMKISSDPILRIRQSDSEKRVLKKQKFHFSLHLRAIFSSHLWLSLIGECRLTLPIFTSPQTPGKADTSCADFLLDRT